LNKAPVVQLQSVSKRYDSVVAVNQVSLEVKQGEILVLLGSSGCGKTTTLRLIAGLERPEAGHILLNGQTVADAKTWVAPELRQIGMVFQDYALFPHLTVGKNIAFPLKSMKKRDIEVRVNELLDLVGMAGLADRFPHQLSGGQQQRVALARALASRPSVVLLDEPFSNLDTALRKQVREEVRYILKQSGATGIFVTHDQEEALSLADRVAVMFEGVLHQHDTPERLYNAPANQKVASFIGEANFLPAIAEGHKARCALGEVRLLQPMQGEVTLLIRPEIVHLLTTDEGAPAEVLWREYYGHHQRVGLRLSDGTELTARTDAQIVYRRGQQVRVSVYAPLLAFEQSARV
jgi:iron(III) transport system ATP-binding protein